jgi:serine/threonine protein kinase
VLDYTCQIANAVEHAHKQGVIHRDLRPANCLRHGEGSVKVGDFGTSRFLEIAAHGTTVIGSPPYMAPEQFEGRAVFCVRSLFARRHDVSDAHRRAAVRHAGPVRSRSAAAGELVEPPRRRNPSVPQVIEDIVMHALSGDVANRYQRAEDLMTDLLNARKSWRRDGPAPAAAHRAAATPPRSIAGTPPDAGSRAYARSRPGRFCWNCHKPLPARGSRCPFCGETQ